MRLLLDGNFYPIDVGLITGGDFNGKRMGGAFFMAPDGDMSDGLLNLALTQQGTRISLLKAMMLYMKGEQSKHRGVYADMKIISDKYIRDYGQY